MNLLLFSDLHTNRELTEGIVKQAARADMIIGAGDFANARQQLRVCIDILKAIERPTILVAGNNETTEELRDACADWPSAHVLHGSSVTVGDLTFFGLGGGVPVTPFGEWSYDFTESQARELLAPCPAHSILITHSPPKGLVDVSSAGKSLGSVAVRETVERTVPRLVVCGHVHASAGQQATLGATSVVNAGPHGILWTI